MGHESGFRPRRRITALLAVLFVFGLALLLFSTPLYYIGKHLEDERTFLKNSRSPNEYEAEIHITMRYILESHDYNDVIFLGDSGGMFSISPALFDQSTGLQSYNLGMIGMFAPRSMLLLLRKYMDNHPRPRAVVICCAPNRFDGNQTDKPIYQRFMWCYGGAEEDRPPHQSAIRDHVSSGGRYLLGELTGGLERRRNEPLQGFDHPDATYDKILRTKTENRGFSRLNPDSWRWTHYRFLGYRDRPFTTSPAFNEAFVELARVCTENNIVLIIRSSPYYEAEAPESWPDLVTWADEWEDTSRNVTFCRPLVLLYPKDWMGDTRHTNDKGVEQFTSLVAEEVTRALARQRNGVAK